MGRKNLVFDIYGCSATFLGRFTSEEYAEKIEREAIWPGDTVLINKATDPQPKDGSPLTDALRGRL